MITALGALHTGRLVLTTEDPQQSVDENALVALLREIGLAGTPRHGAGTFAAGPSLGALVGFTGCAVQFDGDGSGGGPWLRIPRSATAPQLLWGRNTRPPRCPDCASVLRTWREGLAPLSEQDSGLPGCNCDAAAPLHCDSCASFSPAGRWRWGRHAGAGRSLVLIEEVFPGEARPLPALLGSLAGLGAGRWGFFYVQD